MLPGSLLQTLKEAHTLGEDTGRSLNLGVYYKNTLVALCHALEDALLENDYEPLMITAFQRGKWYLQEADRYQDIATGARHITIMAAPDAGFEEHPTGQLANVSLISLADNDPIGQEWHLIILSPRYTAMVLCQELSEADYGSSGLPQHDLERKFYGLWTFDPALVGETVELAIAHLERYNPDLCRHLRAQVAEIATLSGAIAPDRSSHADHLGDVVTRVVQYLQTSQQGLEAQGFEAYPYRLDKNLVSNELQAFLRVAQLIDQTDLKNPIAAAEVATLAESLGQLLDLPAWQLNRLRLAALLHRMDRFSSTRPTLPSSPHPYEDGTAEPPACPLVPGAQLLRRMGRMQAIATILNHQSEAWDGSGFPAGLAGDEIPLEARILGLVACFQQRLAERGVGDRTGTLHRASPDLLADVLRQCQHEANQRWDPKLVDAMTLLVNALRQGWKLSIAMPQVSSGLWLLDSHSEADLLIPKSSLTSKPL